MQNIIPVFCSYQLQNKHNFPNYPKYFYDIILWHIFAPQLQKENKLITDLKTWIMSIRTNILGYPRVGAGRELKKAEEAYWAGKITKDELLKVAAQIRKSNWQLQNQQ